MPCTAAAGLCRHAHRTLAGCQRFAGARLRLRSIPPTPRLAAADEGAKVASGWVFSSGGCNRDGLGNVPSSGRG